MEILYSHLSTAFSSEIGIPLYACSKTLCGCDTLTHVYNTSDRRS